MADSKRTTCPLPNIRIEGTFPPEGTNPFSLILASSGGGGAAKTNAPPRLMSRVMPTCFFRIPCASLHEKMMGTWSR